MHLLILKIVVGQHQMMVHHRKINLMLMINLIHLNRNQHYLKPIQNNFFMKIIHFHLMKIFNWMPMFNYLKVLHKKIFDVLKVFIKIIVL
jgi:hypothetical protein